MTEMQHKYIQAIDKTIEWLKKGKNIHQGNFAVNSIGTIVSPHDCEAVKWCVMGFLMREMQVASVRSYIAAIFGLDPRETNYVQHLMDELVDRNDEGRVDGCLNLLISLKAYLIVSIT